MTQHYLADYHATNHDEGGNVRFRLCSTTMVNGLDQNIILEACWSPELAIQVARKILSELEEIYEEQELQEAEE